MSVSNPQQPLRSIAVVGGGVVARTAALTLARALPAARVTLVAAPVDPAALSDWFPTLLASGRGCLDQWGVDEGSLIAAGCATPRLATRFEAWGAGAAWCSAEGTAMTLPGPGALHQRWLRAARAGGVPPFHTLLPAAAMAEAETFAPDPAAPLDRADHGLRFDPRALVEMLGPVLARAGVRPAAASFAETLRGADGTADAIRLRDDTTMTADLFVDATGPAALLAPPAPFLDWAGALPADRLLIASDQPSPPTLDRYRRWRGGWTARWPGPRRAVQAVAYAAATTDETMARRAFADPETPAALVTLAPGRRASCWTGRCLALGEAAAQFGALGLVGFTFAQAQLALMLDLMPARAMPASLTTEYDRLAGLRADRLRDWLAAHHLGAAAGPFWAATRAPASLAETLAQFAQRGTLPHHDEESVDAAAWHAVLIGQGLRPRRDDPLAMAAAPRDLARDLTRGARLLADAAAALPRIGSPRAREAR